MTTQNINSDAVFSHYNAQESLLLPVLVVGEGQNGIQGLQAQIKLLSQSRQEAFDYAFFALVPYASRLEEAGQHCWVGGRRCWSLNEVIGALLADNLAGVEEVA